MGWTWSLSTLSSCQSRANKKHKRLNNCYDLFTVSIFSLVVYFHFFLWLNRCRVRFGVLLRLIICCTTLFLFFVFCVIELLFSFFLGTLQTLCVFNRVFNFFFFGFQLFTIFMISSLYGLIYTVIEMNTNDFSKSEGDFVFILTKTYIISVFDLIYQVACT